MSSWHIRATKIKHASPPSAGWLLSLGRKTAVTHEQSPQTKTCTLCKWWRETARTVNTHTHTHRRVLCFSRAVRVACWLLNCLCPGRTCSFSGLLWGLRRPPPPAMSVPGSALVTFDDATLTIFPAVQLIDHPLALQEWCPAAPTQSAGGFLLL